MSYIDKREAAKSWRPKSGTMSPGLQRAREPYRVKNAIVGLTLGAFAIGVWAYSISAVKQDVFDDVDEEVEALGRGSGRAAPTPTMGRATTTPSEVVAKAKANAKAGAGAGVTASTPSVKSSPILEEIGTAHADTRPVASSTRGILPRWESVLRIPGWFTLLDPERKTVVWGAPPVDDVGKIGGRS